MYSQGTFKREKKCLKASRVNQRSVNRLPVRLNLGDNKLSINPLQFTSKVRESRGSIVSHVENGRFCFSEKNKSRHAANHGASSTQVDAVHVRECDFMREAFNGHYSFYLTVYTLPLNCKRVIFIIIENISNEGKEYFLFV